MEKVSSAAVTCVGNITACSKMDFLSIKILSIMNFCHSAFLSESFRDFDKQSFLISIGHD
jgi:hypothetical protein